MNLDAFSSHRALTRAALFGMLLRIAVPVGLMPADPADGWLLQLCPDGLPAHVAAVLLGHAHHLHGDAAESGYVQCDLGGWSGTAPPGQPLDLPIVDVGERLAAPPDAPAPHLARARAYQSRAPPAVTSLG